MTCVFVLNAQVWVSLHGYSIPLCLNSVMAECHVVRPLKFHVCVRKAVQVHNYTPFLLNFCPGWTIGIPGSNESLWHLANGSDVILMGSVYVLQRSTHMDLCVFCTALVHVCFTSSHLWIHHELYTIWWMLVFHCTSRAWFSVSILVVKWLFSTLLFYFPLASVITLLKLRYTKGANCVVHWCGC